MNSGSFKKCCLQTIRTKIIYIHIYIYVCVCVCVCKQDLALNNPK